jgi:hypothetical protein
MLAPSLTPSRNFNHRAYLNAIVLTALFQQGFIPMSKNFYDVVNCNASHKSAAPPIITHSSLRIFPLQCFANNALLYSLASGTKECAALSHNNAFNRRFADGACFVFPMCHCEFCMGRSLASIGMTVVAYACPQLLNSLVEYMPYRFMQSNSLYRREGTGWPERVDFGMEKGFICIHIAYACNQFLV